MLEIGVQTKGILPEMNIDKGFRLISEAGFSRVDINIDTFLKNNDLYAGKVNKFFDASVEELYASPERSTLMADYDTWKKVLILL